MAQNKILNFEDARNAAHELAKIQSDIKGRNKEIFENLLKEVEKVNPALGGFEELSMLIALPEEHFAMLGPVFLMELEKSFNNIEDKLFIAQAMNAAGVKMEDLQKSYKELIDSLDNELTGVISKQKIDFLKRFLSLSYDSIADLQGVTKRVIQVPIELTSEGAKIPTYANLGDGAVDLYAPEDFTIGPGETKIIPCDIKVALPYGYAFLIHPRSGLSAKTKLRVANSVGLVDSQYKGVIGVILENIEPRIKDVIYEFDDNHRPVIKAIEHGQSYTISKGDRFAQMRLVEVPQASFFQVDSVDGIGDDRGGGFGSSGDK